MNRFTAPKPFLDAAIAAFPSNRRAAAMIAARELAPIVDDAYRQRALCLVVDGQNVYVPYRLHFLGAEKIFEERVDFSLVARCLLTRSTDGHLRQQALKSIIKHPEILVIPFVMLLLGEYVVEIVNEILLSLPELDRTAYADFVRQNRPAMHVLRAKATSYWDVYYRQAYANRSSYPGLAALDQLETWAS
jgi:hypothetical protein